MSEQNPFKANLRMLTGAALEGNIEQVTQFTAEIKAGWKKALFNDPKNIVPVDEYADAKYETTRDMLTVLSSLNELAQGIARGKVHAAESADAVTGPNPFKANLRMVAEAALEGDTAKTTQLSNVIKAGWEKALFKGPEHIVPVDEWCDARFETTQDMVTALSSLTGLAQGIASWKTRSADPVVSNVVAEPGRVAGDISRGGAGTSL